MTTVATVLVRLGADLRDFRAGMSDVVSQLDRVQSKMNQVGSTFQSAGKTLSMAVTAPIVGIGAAVVTMGNQFNDELNKIVGLVGISRDQVNAWKDDIMNLSRATAIGPKELAEGLFFVTSAGFRGAAAMDVLTISARAATAGLGETKTVADTITSAVNAYGMENLSAARAADILTAAVREGKLEAESLAPVMGRLLPTASAMGISFEQVAGALAVMSRTGLNAAEASTSLGAVMSTLLKPSTDAQKTLKAVGLEMADLRRLAVEQPDGLIQVMRLLDQAFGDNEEALAKVIPNVRAFRGVMNVLSQDASIVDSVMAGVANSTGALDHAFNSVAEGAGFKMQQAMNEIRVELTRLGDVVGPVVADTIVPLFRQAVTELSALVTAFRELPAPAQKAIVLFAMVAAAIGPVVFLVGTLLKGLAALILTIKLMGAALVFLAANPIGLAIVAIVALGVAIFLLIRHWDTVTAKVSGAASAIKDRVVGALEEVGDFIRRWPIVALLAGPFAPAALFAADVFGVRSALTKALGGLLVDAKGLWNDVTRLFRLGFEGGEIGGFSGLRLAAFEFGKDAGEAFRKVETQAKDLGRTLVREVGDPLRLFRVGFEGGIIGGEFGKIEEAAFRLGKTLHSVEATFAPVVETARQKLSEVGEVAKGLPGLLALGFEGGKIGGEWSKIEIAVFKGGQALRQVFDFIKANWSEIETLLTYPLRAVLSFSQFTWDALKALVVNGADAMVGHLKLVWGLITGDWKLAWEGIQQIMRAAWNFINDIGNAGMALLQRLLELGWDVIKATARLAWAALGEDIQNTIRDIIRWIRDLPREIESAASSFLQAGRRLGESLWEGIKGGLNAVIGGVNRVLDYLRNLRVDIPSVGIGPVRTPGGTISIRGVPEPFSFLAHGTDFWRGGLAVVGDAGPELVELPRGARIHPAARTRGILEGQGVTVNFLGPTTINARDRDEARRAAGDVGYGIAAAARLRGVAV